VLTLVLGGVRSGKSDFAAALAERDGRPVTFLATGTASDPEMARRIDDHRRRRPLVWAVVEEPLAVEGVVPSGVEVLLLDSVDTWLGNRMEARGGAAAVFTAALRDELESACAAELAALEASVAHLVAVSAETGLSLVPANPYGRAFSEVLGGLNQRLARRADAVHLLVAGIPIPIHPYKER
jgi:adenosylcobinamide kinase/adenosylcobinamide-phosphate guanylyltransferase